MVMKAVVASEILRLFKVRNNCTGVRLGVWENTRLKGALENVNLTNEIEEN